MSHRLQIALLSYRYMLCPSFPISSKGGKSDPAELIELLHLSLSLTISMPPGAYDARSCHTHHYSSVAARYGMVCMYPACEEFHMFDIKCLTTIRALVVYSLR